MSYTHILVAVDLSDESQILVKKAINLARATQAKVSLIHIDVIQDDEFTRKIVRSIVAESGAKDQGTDSQQQLEKLKEQNQYPIEHTLIGYGTLNDELEDAVEEYEFDLIICGHHQDFWHNLSSSTKQMMKTLPVDMLVVPLK